MTFEDLVFEKDEMDGFSMPTRQGYVYSTAIRAAVEFPNGFGLSVIGGSFWHLHEGSYEAMGLFNGSCCTTTLENTARYQAGWPAYFKDPERHITPDRITEMLQEVEVMKPVLVFN